MLIIITKWLLRTVAKKVGKTWSDFKNFDYVGIMFRGGLRRVSDQHRYV